MKLFSAVLLAISLSADAFVVQPTAPSSTTSTSLKDVGLQWGFDEHGCRTEYYLEHWTDRNSDSPKDYWPYQPWSGVSQTIFVPDHNPVIEEMQQGFGAGMNAQVHVQQQQQQQAALPPAQPVQPMPEVQVPTGMPQMSYLDTL